MLLAGMWNGAIAMENSMEVALGRKVLELP